MAAEASAKDSNSSRSIALASGQMLRNRSEIDQPVLIGARLNQLPDGRRNSTQLGHTCRSRPAEAWTSLQTCSGKYVSSNLRATQQRKPAGQSSAESCSIRV